MRFCEIRPSDAPAPQMQNSAKSPLDSCGYFRPKVGEVVNGYAFCAQLGQGVFGRVFRVEKGGNVYACKVSRSGR